MKFRHSIVIGVWFVSGCTVLPENSVKPATANCPAPRAWPAHQDGACPQPPGMSLEELLAYNRHVHELSGSDLTHELMVLNEQARSEHGMLERAMVLAQAHDWQRAINALDPILKTADSDRYKPLAQLLVDQYTEQRHLEEQTDRLQQQARDLQRHVEQLNDKLEALKNIERNLGHEGHL